MNIAEMVARKQEDSAAWVERKQAEREDTIQRLENGVAAVTSSPEKFTAYLEKQGQIPYYSAGNTILIMDKNPQAIRVGGMDFWNKQGRNIIKGEKGIPILVSQRYDRKKAVQDVDMETGEVINRIERQRGRGYNIGRVFDISQTKGKDMPPAYRLAPDTEDMQQAIAGLLQAAPVPVHVNENLPVPALYDASEMVVYVRSDAEGPELFKALANEVCHARMHGGISGIEYDRAGYDLYAQATSYMLCKRYGLECATPDFSAVPQEFGGLAHEHKLQSLGLIRDIAGSIGDKVRDEIGRDKVDGKPLAVKTPRVADMTR